MFIDTKNLANANSNTEACNIKNDNAKTNGKLKGLWRLLKIRKNSKRKSASIAHPNNVNLNNSNAVPQTDIEVLTTAQLEDYCAKFAAESAKQSVDYEASTAECFKVISSVSIEKDALSAVNCIYGKNCQHNHKALHDKQLFSSYVDQASFIVEPQFGEHVPINYLHTENGSFFWPETFERVDDDLLNVWLCQSLGQFPAQASVC